jgi:hypothetical protein
VADKQRAITTGLPAILTAIGAAVLLVLAAIRWRDYGWGALVTNGVYAHIRHPMYAAIWLSAPRPCGTHEVRPRAAPPPQRPRHRPGGT